MGEAKEVKGCRPLARRKRTSPGSSLIKCYNGGAQAVSHTLGFGPSRCVETGPFGAEKRLAYTDCLIGTNKTFA